MAQTKAHKQIKTYAKKGDMVSAKVRIALALALGLCTVYAAARHACRLNSCGAL